MGRLLIIVSIELSGTTIHTLRPSLPHLIWPHTHSSHPPIPIHHSNDLLFVKRFNTELEMYSTLWLLYSMYLIDERIRTKLQIEWCKILEIKSNKIKWREEIIENVYLTIFLSTILPFRFHLAKRLTPGAAELARRPSSFPPFTISWISQRK